MANVGTAAAGKTLIGAGNGASPTYADIGTNSGLAAHGVVLAEGNSPFVVASPGLPGTILMSNGAGSNPSFQSGGSSIGNTITGDSGGALSPTAGNWNLLGSGSITTSGSGSTLTTQLTGLTNHTVLVGAGTATITKVGPGSTGQVLQSGGASADPAYSTATYPSTAGTSGNVLTSNGTNWTSSALPAGVLITTFTSSGSWSINSKSVTVEFYIWAAGSGGGSGRCGASASAGGGGGGPGGTFFYTKCPASSLVSSPYTITIGAGGGGGALVNATTTNGNPGTAGGTSSIGSDIPVGTLNVGLGGTTGNAAAQSSTGAVLFGPGFTTLNGGSGSSTSGFGATSGSFVWATGGGGAAGYTSATPVTGGAGGNIRDFLSNNLALGGTAGDNSGNTAGNGNTLTAVYFIKGGTGGGGGGHNGITTAGTGGNGAQPGGGGGGGAGNLNLNNSGAGGSGGDGKIIIVEYF